MLSCADIGAYADMLNSKLRRYLGSQWGCVLFLQFQVRTLESQDADRSFRHFARNPKGRWYNATASEKVVALECYNRAPPRQTNSVWLRLRGLCVSVVRGTRWRSNPFTMLAPTYCGNAAATCSMGALNTTP